MQTGSRFTRHWQPEESATHIRHVGMNTGSMWAALLGVALTMSGILIPSTILSYSAAQWGHRNRERREVRAFKQGMTPIVIALLASTGWILASSHGNALENWRLWLLASVVTVVIWKTRIHLLWLLGAGGVLGWLGWV